MIEWLIALAALLVCVPVSLKLTKMTLDPYSAGALKTKEQLEHFTGIGVLAVIIVVAWSL